MQEDLEKINKDLIKVLTDNGYVNVVNVYFERRLSMFTITDGTYSLMDAKFNITYDHKDWRQMSVPEFTKLVEEQARLNDADEIDTRRIETICAIDMLD